MAAAVLQFPSKADLVSYLGQHPKTTKESHSCFADQKVIEAVAEYFANQKKAPAGIKMGVNLVMFKENDRFKNRLHLTDRDLESINRNLTEALRDCAQGKSLGEEKKDR